MCAYEQPLPVFSRPTLTNKVSSREKNLSRAAVDELSSTGHCNLEGLLLALGTWGHKSQSL